MDKPKYTAVITTTLSRYDIVKITLEGLLSQSSPPTSILVNVDVKPGSMAWPNVPVADVRIQYMFNRSSSLLKRQHELSDQALCMLPEETVVLLMDDDYTSPSTNAMSHLLSFQAQGFDFVFPERVSLSESRIINVIGDECGHHPWCGHPKIFTIKTYLSLGGLDWPSFPHYGWCDTDIWYKFKKAGLKFHAVSCELSPWTTTQDVQKPAYSAFLERNAVEFRLRWGNSDQMEPIHDKMTKR